MKLHKPAPTKFDSRLAAEYTFRKFCQSHVEITKTAFVEQKHQEAEKFKYSPLAHQAELSSKIKV